jgi:hypothetical protein
VEGPSALIWFRAGIRPADPRPHPPADWRCDFAGQVSAIPYSVVRRPGQGGMVKLCREGERPESFDRFIVVRTGTSCCSSFRSGSKVPKGQSRAGQKAVELPPACRQAAQGTRKLETQPPSASSAFAIDSWPIPWGPSSAMISAVVMPWGCSVMVLRTVDWTKPRGCCLPCGVI